MEILLRHFVWGNPSDKRGMQLIFYDLSTCLKMMRCRTYQIHEISVGLLVPQKMFDGSPLMETI